MAYTFLKTVTIDYTKCGGSDSSNFPFLFNSTLSEFKTVANGGRLQNSNGYDLAFFSDSGLTTPLDFDIDTYIGTTGQYVAWVRIPTLSHTVDTVIYIGYGDSGISTFQGNTNGVWDSNFKCVYHLGDGTTIGLSDSTSNANTLTNVGSITAAAGQIGGGTAALNGSTQHFTASGPTINAGSAITVSAWINQSSGTLTAASLFTVGSAGGANRIQAHCPYNDKHIYWDYGTWRADFDATAFLDAWVLVHLTCNASGSAFNIYVNGTQRVSTSTIPPTSNETGLDLGHWSSSGFTKEQIDEFRVATTERSADWITQEWNNQNSPATFYSLSGGALIGGQYFPPSF
jgi:hypothetical protein